MLAILVTSHSSIPWQPCLLTVSIDLPIHIICCLCCVWILSFNVLFSIFIHVIACVSISFLHPFLDWITFHFVDILSTFSFTQLIFGLCPLLGIMYFAGMNIHIQTSVWIFVFNSLKYILRSKISRSYRNSMFSFFRTCQTVSHSSYTIFYSH